MTKPTGGPRAAAADHMGKPRSGLVAVVSASTIGTVLEWYDFYIYGTAAALVFGPLFFPSGQALSGTLAAFATFAVGFLARPLGGLLFANAGDKIGRKPVLVATLIVMGLGTALIGCLPTYDAIGPLAPILLVLLRVLQGLGAGAEYAGAALMSVEHSSQRRRGLSGSMPAAAVYVATVLSTAVFALTNALPKDQFLSWGWRVPFLLSLLGMAIGFYIRTRISESPEFLAQKKTSAVERTPVLAALRKNPKRVLLGMGIMTNGVHSYFFLVFLLSYVTTTLRLPASVGLTGMLIAAGLSLVTIPLFGALSDRIGYRTLTIGGALFTAAFAFPVFWLLNTGASGWIWIAEVVGLTLGVNAMWGPQGAFLAGLFEPRIRYSGMVLAREIPGALLGGTAPFVAAFLMERAGGQTWGVSLYMIAAAILVAVSAYFLPETSRQRPALPDKTDTGAPDLAAER